MQTTLQQVPGKDPLSTLSTLGIKGRLMDAVYCTSRGLDISREQRATVEELVAVLEARNSNRNLRTVTLSQHPS